MTAMLTDRPTDHAADDLADADTSTHNIRCMYALGWPTHILAPLLSCTVNDVVNLAAGDLPAIPAALARDISTVARCLNGGRWMPAPYAESIGRPDIAARFRALAPGAHISGPCSATAQWAHDQGWRTFAAYDPADDDQPRLGERPRRGWLTQEGWAQEMAENRLFMLQSALDGKTDQHTSDVLEVSDRSVARVRLNAGLNVQRDPDWDYGIMVRVNATGRAFDIQAVLDLYHDNTLTALQACALLSIPVKGRGPAKKQR